MRSPYRPTVRRNGNAVRVLIYIVMAVIAVCLLGAIAYGCAASNRVQVKTFTIQDKESVTTRGSDGNSDHEYRVYTTDGVYTVSDSLLHAHFNSADTYARLQRGRRYTCKVTGFRVPVFSSFQNILSCTERL